MNFTKSTFAHEMSHLLGRRHTNSNTCSPQNIDLMTDWPYTATDSLIHSYGLDGYGFGWLLSSATALKKPIDTYDYMSYCGDLSPGANLGICLDV